MQTVTLKFYYQEEHMTDRYQSPLSERYASKEMQYIFSPDKKFRTWRRLWIALAESEQELGLPITDEQIAELKAHQDDINYDVAKAREKEVRHDVMSHVYHSSGCDVLLCRRQHRSDPYDGGTAAGEEEVGERYGGAFPLRGSLQVSSHSWFYTFSAGAADHSWQARDALADGSEAGLR